MKPGVQRKPADSRERDTGAQGAGTLAYVEARSQVVNDEDERGSGVRKIEEAKRAARQSEAGGVGKHVGPYRLLECIGEGAMGYVYRAEHTLIGRVVAIKMLRAELTHDGACVQRFLAEARAVNLIKHPHIIDVTDFASTPEGQPWFVMELLHGSDLLDVASREPLSLARTLEIVRQVCEALAAVHAAGIVHRDVKPENVFLQRRDGEDFVTLLDFGIARLPDPENADPLQDGLMGTAYYMAPEQASADPIDHRADLYALGSTLFELVAGIGRTPFRAEHLQQQLLQVVMTPAPRLSDRATVPAIVRKDLDVLLERLLAKDPSERPSSASEVASELARIAAKLEGRSSSPASDVSAPMLNASDAMAPVVTAKAARKRARRAARAGSSSTAWWAIVLSAVAAAAAVWIATREANWAHVVRRAVRGDGSTARPNGSEHIARPMDVELDVPAAPAGEPAGAVQAAQSSASALPAGKSIDAIGDDRSKRDSRRARRAERAKPRPEPEPSAEVEAAPAPEAIVVEQPALTIEPALVQEPPRPPEPEPLPEAVPEAEPPVLEDEPSIDRDVVLNPFDS